ncbi:MAG: TonB family protein, partial [bacterium]
NLPDELEKEVNSVGLLGLISSDSKSIDHDYVQDLLEYASENSEHLAQVLAKLNSIEVPHYGSNGYLKKIRTDGISDEYSGLKGGRTNADDEVNKIIKNVEPLKSIETKPMKRNIHYEEVPSDYLNKLADGNVAATNRSAQDVMRIVQSHTRALQDCYKQELRYDPGISGKIVVRFTIDTDGNIKNTSVISSTLNSPRMEECILHRIKRWRNFPPCDPAIGDKTYRQSFSFGE